MIAVAAPVLVHAAHGLGHGHSDAHRRQVAHMEERQLIGGILGGGNSTTPTAEDDDTPTSRPPTPTTSSRDTTDPTSTLSSVVPPSPTSSSRTGTGSGSLTSSMPSGTGAVSSTSSMTSSASSASTTGTSSQSSSSSSQSQSMSMSESVSLGIDAAGKTVTQVVTVPVSPTPTSSSSQTSAAATNDDKKEDGPAIGTGAIIGIAVGVGAVVFGLIGMAIWRMKRRGGDEDEAIRWPELNRHGDSDAHHALPARQTGQHGIETSPLERSLTNGSDMYLPAHSASTHHHTHMALGGSNFGVASSLEGGSAVYDEKDLPLPNPHGVSPGGNAGAYDAYEQYYAQQTQPHPSALQPHAGYDAYGNPSDNYASFPPQVGMQVGPGQGGPGMAYDSDSEGHGQGHVGMGQVGGPVSYGQHR